MLRHDTSGLFLAENYEASSDLDCKYSLQILNNNIPIKWTKNVPLFRKTDGYLKKSKIMQIINTSLRYISVGIILTVLRQIYAISPD